MTSDPNRDADAVFAARVDGLVASLEEMKSKVGAASRSEIAVLNLMRSADEFWRDQGPLLRQVTTSVLMSLRIQALEQAYGWREQLVRALDAQARQDPRRPNAEASE